jgi:hypothetical protein
MDAQFPPVSRKSLFFRIRKESFSLTHLIGETEGVYTLWEITKNEIAKTPTSSIDPC